MSWIQISIYIEIFDWIQICINFDRTVFCQCWHQFSVNIDLSSLSTLVEREGGLSPLLSLPTLARLATLPHHQTDPLLEGYSMIRSSTFLNVALYLNAANPEKKL
jgi:hypothetical protein